tara:strand:- start:415 stop:1194 length:780 start_codon:yes stop_codon:yes gene_type:complete
MTFPVIKPSVLLSSIPVFALFAFQYISILALVSTGLLITLLYQDKPLFRGYAPLRMTLLIVLSALLLLHQVPGFNNIEIYRNLTFSKGAIAYSQFINFDKLIIAIVFLPYLLCRDKASSTHRHWRKILGWSVLTIVVVFCLALLLGLGVWEVKVPPHPFIFFACMLFITVTAEECLFRGVLQKGLTDKIGILGVVLVSGLFFGAVHIGFSPLFALVSVVAGLGYGLSYYYSNNIYYPIALHFTLNTVHVLFFSYPMLMR